MPDDQKEEKETSLLPLFVWASCVYAVGVVMFIVYRIDEFYKPYEVLQINEMGDWLAGCFAPLAFAWFVYTAITQRRELEAARKAYKEHTAVGDKAAKQAQIEVVRQLLKDYVNNKRVFFDELNEKSKQAREVIQSLSDERVMFGWGVKNKVNIIRGYPANDQLAVEIDKIDIQSIFSIVLCADVIKKKGLDDPISSKVLSLTEGYMTLKNTIPNLVINFEKFFVALEKIYDKDVLSICILGSDFDKYYKAMFVCFDINMFMQYKNNHNEIICIDPKDIKPYCSEYVE